MIFLARRQILTGANPLLDIFFQNDGLLVDVYSLEFEVWKTPGGGEPTQVGTRTALNVSATYPTAGAARLSKGRYFAPWTVPETAQAQHEIRWFYKLTSTDDERMSAQPFEVLTVPVIAPTGLCSIADMRADGLSLDSASDYRCHQSIIRATAFIERICRRPFYPVRRSFTLSSQGTSPVLLLPSPIVGIESVKVAWDSDFSTAEPLAESSYRVFARHLSEGIVFEADDRNNPKIERINTIDGRRYWRGPDWEQWPVGDRNIQVTGAFGYTEPDGATGGRTPELIRLACAKLATKYATSKAAGSAASSAESAAAVGPVKRLRTKDREIEFSDAAAAHSSAAGLITSDAEVDGILEMFLAPPGMATW